MAELIVTTLTDELDDGATVLAPGGDGLSLREAIGLATNGDTVVFQDGLAGTIRITEALGNITIGADVTIYGDDRITISGDSNGDDTTVSGITDVAATAATELDDNQQIFALDRGLSDVVLDGLMLTGGRGENLGGAIATYTSTLTVKGSTLAGNVVYGGYGGGAIYSYGYLNVEDSTFSGNIAIGGDSGEGHGGGAIFSLSGSVSVTNSTFVGNQALQGDVVNEPSGGAIFSNGGPIGSTYLNNVTMTGNLAEFQGGGLFVNNASSDVTITNSIILGNKATETTDGFGNEVDGLNAPAFDISNSITDGDNAAEIFAETVTVNDRTAGVLADNGGPVQTVALIGSLLNPALDAATSTGPDARGEARVDLANVDNGGPSDLGAFELQLGDDVVAPTFSGAAAFSVGETLLSGLNFTPITADDLTDVTFSIDGGADAGAVSIDPMTGVLSFNAAVDFENPSDANGDNTFEVIVKATDLGGNSATDNITISISDVDEAPVITSGAALSAAENQIVAGAIVVSDDKAGVAFSITGGADAALFVVDATTGDLSFVTTPDFEAPADAGANNVYDVQVTAIDSGDQTAVQSLTVGVTNVNEAPVAANATASGDEDTIISGTLTATDVDGDALTFTQASGPSNGALMISTNGAFTFTPDADFNGTDSFTFRASDDALSDTAMATITVNPVDEPIDPNIPTPGDDTLVGTALNDTIDALAGNDNVTGLAGDDLLFGRGGDDSIRGLAGDDSLRGNGGDDTLRGNGGDDNIKGNGGEDLIRGNGGDDVIRAGGGADDVKGGGGADLIFGGGGADKLNGGGGADTLRGNGGDDTLKGNGGADVFQFRASDRNDTIADFRQGQDKIQIQSGANSFEALSIEQDGRDVLIGFGTGQVRVITDNAGAFDESDFIF